MSVQQQQQPPAPAATVHKPPQGGGSYASSGWCGMVSRVFKVHGSFCASHPWEVIVATLTLTVCVLSVETRVALQDAAAAPSPACNAWRRNCPSGLEQPEYNAADVIVMTLIRCVALLYSYHQFRTLSKMGSKYILGIAGLFTVFSSFVFSSSVINFLRSDVSDLKDALFFFLLLIDLSKTTLLARLALSSNSQAEVRNNIARGMAILGPTITLDTVVETLVIGVGTLSGVRRLEVLCGFAVLSVLVNYIVFMTFYPACLSLILELTRSSEENRPLWNDKSLMMGLQEEEQKPNPVVQRVKVIMSAGLMLVHARSRWPFRTEEEDILSVTSPAGSLGTEHNMPSNNTEEAEIPALIMKWLTVSADQVVILILLLALAVKYVFFEERDELAEQLLMPETPTGEESYANRAYLMRFGPPGLEPMCHAETAEKVQMEERGVQTELSSCGASFSVGPLKSEDVEKGTDVSTITPPQTPAPKRNLEECLSIYRSVKGAAALSDEEVINLVNSGHIPPYQIEKAISDYERGVFIRRQIVGKAGSFIEALESLPFRNYDYSKVMGSCCENVIGYMPVPVGVVGPLNLDDDSYYVPMATTEGCLVASTHRGCKAVLSCGVSSRVVADGMTRGPVVRFPSMTSASEAMHWMQQLDNYEQLKESFDSTSRYARLKRLQVRIAGRHLFIRFVATTGDAMGMNMLSKGTEIALKLIQKEFPEMEILSLSGNFCTDKKPAAVNWIEGRGKYVVCEAIVPAKIVTNVLKTSVQALIDVNIAKNMMGSAMAGSIGGFNAHAANIVTAIYIATGQDPAQNVGSSNCMTLMEPWGEDGKDLYVTCTMPSIEIGTVGGGTTLPAQASCLDILRVKGASKNRPGENADTLARIVCGTVLAGELSLMSALAAGHLVRSHLRHNRSSTSNTSMEAAATAALFNSQKH
ncbi:3-hydroxy-3-methylglutaryl-coenzyme A reductase isoform X1 [Cloeon dipterum]|uniref:3-hydroxy-3-methylglutaryl-coenzyme A reductase isoform X1 n=2 Tax=Cloeon dipterum TaxID=197152 RepID=UPI0032209AE1